MIQKTEVQNKNNKKYIKLEEKTKIDERQEKE